MNFVKLMEEFLNVFLSKFPPVAIGKLFVILFEPLK